MMCCKPINWPLLKWLRGKEEEKKKLLPASLFWCSSTSCLFGEYLQIVKLPYAHTHFCSTFFSWYYLQSQSILSCLTFRVHKKRRKKKEFKTSMGYTLISISYSQLPEGNTVNMIMKAMTGRHLLSQEI